MAEAIIETGSKQYRVKKGDVIDIELVKAGKAGAVEFKNVLLINDGKHVMVGAPHVEGYVVKGKVEDEVKGEKTVHFVYRRRTASSKRKKGHRQRYSRVKITSIAKAKGDDNGA